MVPWAGSYLAPHSFFLASEYSSIYSKWNSFSWRDWAEPSHPRIMYSWCLGCSFGSGEIWVQVSTQKWKFKTGCLTTQESAITNGLNVIQGDWPYPAFLKLPEMDSSSLLTSSKYFLLTFWFVSCTEKINYLPSCGCEDKCIKGCEVLLYYNNWSHISTWDRLILLQWIPRASCMEKVFLYLFWFFSPLNFSKCPLVL